MYLFFYIDNDDDKLGLFIPNIAFSYNTTNSPVQKSFLWGGGKYGRCEKS